MARSDLFDLKGPLARALGKVAEAGPASVLAPVWAEAVGPTLAARSRPVRFQDAVLTVVADPEFLPHLEQQNAMLRDRLNGQLGRGAVRLIRYLKEGTIR